MSTKRKHARQRIEDNGFEDVLLFENYSYDSALIGVTTDNRAVYDYDKMIEWLMETQGFAQHDAVEWVEYNTIRALSYYGDDAPIIIYPLEE